MTDTLTTLSRQINNTPNGTRGFSMAGKVRTRERFCRGCKTEYRIIEEVSISCPSCGREPRTFFVFLYWQKQKLRIPRDTDGHILDSYRRAHRLLEAIRREIDAGLFSPTHYVLKEIEAFRGRALLPKWLEMVKARGRAKSYTDKLDGYVNNIFLPRFGVMDIRQLRNSDIEDLRHYLAFEYENQRSGGRIAPKTIKNIMDAFKEFCIWLHRREVVPRVPYFEPVDVPEYLVEIMPLDHRHRVLEHIASPNQRAILEFMSMHPVRPSEAAALDVRHFDLENRAVIIENALDSDGSLKPRKSKKAYVIPLSREWNPAPVLGRFGKEIAFPNARGNRYNANRINDAWRRGCKKAEVPYVSVYPSTRHTTATAYASRGVSQGEISRMLGQSTPSMSEKYVKRSVEMLRNVVDIPLPIEKRGRK